MIRKAYSMDANASLRDTLSRYRGTWTSIQKSPLVRVEVVQKLLDDLTSSFTTALLSSAEKHCKEKKKFDPFKSTCSDDSMLKELEEKRIMLRRQLDSCFAQEQIRISIRRSLKQADKEYGKRIKVLRKQKEHDFYTLLETKSLREQQRMIRFERNGKQRPGVKKIASR